MPFLHAWARGVTGFAWEEGEQPVRALCRSHAGKANEPVMRGRVDRMKEACIESLGARGKAWCC